MRFLEGERGLKPPSILTTLGVTQKQATSSFELAFEYKGSLAQRIVEQISFLVLFVPWQDSQGQFSYPIPGVPALPFF